MSELPKVGDINVNYPQGPHIFTDKGWMLCDGRLLSRKDYSVLYSRIGMAYSDEDLRCCNSEQFAIPELREWEKRK